ncbi:hypothetical protein V6N13_148164 [Hibiscus sabdariffa]
MEETSVELTHQANRKRRQWKRRVQKAGLASADVRLVLYFFQDFSVLLGGDSFPCISGHSSTDPATISTPEQQENGSGPRYSCGEKSHNMHYPSRARTTIPA